MSVTTNYLMFQVIQSGQAPKSSPPGYAESLAAVRAAQATVLPRPGSTLATGLICTYDLGASQSLAGDMVEVGRRVAHQAMHVIWVDQTPGWGGPQFSHIDKAPADNSTLAVYFDANTASGLFFEGPVSSCNTSADNWTNGAFEALVVGEWSAVGASTAPPR